MEVDKVVYLGERLTGKCQEDEYKIKQAKFVLEQCCKHKIINRPTELHEVLKCTRKTVEDANGM